MNTKPEDAMAATNAQPFPPVTHEQIRKAVLNGCRAAIEAARGAAAELPEPVRESAAMYAAEWAVNTLRFENGFARPSAIPSGRY